MVHLARHAAPCRCRARGEVLARRDAVSTAKPLCDKTALVTGSSSGIGRGVAIGLAEAGCSHVVVNFPTEQDRDAADEVREAVEEAGASCAAIMADVGREDQCKQLAEEASRFAGGIEILVNNAGIAHSDTIEAMPLETWDRVMNIHARGTFLMTRELLPEMYRRNSGRIINTVSQLAYKGAPGLSAYTAAKGAILSFTRSLALEIGSRNVRANCVAPGATQTPILYSVGPDVLEAIKAEIPVGHLAQVDDIVPTYVFLASRAGDHFQGQCLSPNGGDQFL